MRTTIDLPEEVFRRAKIAAIERGTTLRELVGLALARELGLNRNSLESPHRSTFPIFQSQSPGTLDLTAWDLSGLEAEEDTRRHG